MMNLFLGEMKKLFRPWNHRLIIVVILLYPFLHMGLSLRHDAQSFLQDEYRIPLTGVIDETWMQEVDDTLQTMNPDGSYEEQLHYQTVEKALIDASFSFQLKQSLLQDETTPAIVVQDLQASELRFGPYEDWLLHFDVLSVGALLFGICCIYLFCNSFNQEEASGAMDLLKSSKKGRNPLAIAKVSVTCLTSVLLGIAFYFMTQLASRWMIGTMDPNVSIHMLKVPQYLTFGEVNQMYLWILILGGLISTMIAIFLSSITKNPHTSLALGILTYVLPSMMKLDFLNTNWEGLFPVSFLHGMSGILRHPWLTMNGFTHHALIILMMVWIPLMLCMLVYILWHQHHVLRLLESRGKKDGIETCTVK